MPDRGAPYADPETIRRVLQERAHALAQPLLTEEPSDTVELVVMVLGPERYGVDSRHVGEIVGIADVTPVPGAPAFWRGIVNVRGTLYPVLDLCRYLSLPEGDTVNRRGAVVLVAGAGLTIGIVVDDVPEVRRVRVAAIGPLLLDGAPDVGRDSIRGLTDDLLTVLDLDAVLGDAKLAIREDPL